MEKQDFIDYWIKTSKHDLQVAESLLYSRHFDYCFFMSHLSLEKLLKAFWVKDNIENSPPKTHNLVYLSKKSKLELDDNQLKFLQFVNAFNISIRYPDYKLKIYQMCNEEFTKKHFEKIKEFHKWLMKRL
jgi:HEPN domain-containing protein